MLDQENLCEMGLSKASGGVTYHQPSTRKIAHRRGGGDVTIASTTDARGRRRPRLNVLGALRGGSESDAPQRSASVDQSGSEESALKQRRQIIYTARRTTLQFDILTRAWRHDRTVRETRPRGKARLLHPCRKIYDVAA